MLYNRCPEEGSLYNKCIEFEFNYIKSFLMILSIDVCQHKPLTTFYDIIAINLIYFTIKPTLVISTNVQWNTA